MMKRFSRRRRGASGDVAIDAERCMGQILEEKVLPLKTLEPLNSEAVAEVPASYAAIGSGETEAGEKVLVSFAPRNAGDALLGGLIAAAKLVEDEGFSGELIIVAPHWSLQARRRLGLVSPQGIKLRAVSAPGLADGPGDVESEPTPQPGVVSVAAVANQLMATADRELFTRACAALEGLASKHGGGVRGFERSVELVIMARRVAELRADESGALLNTFLPSRSTQRLSTDDLAGVLDGLEGSLRKRLNDRRTREGDEGLRARLHPLVATALNLHSVVQWPVGGKDLDVIDSIGVNSDGCPVATAARGSLSLAALGVILDAALDMRASLPVLLADSVAPVRLELYRLALVSREFAPGVARVLPLLNLSHDLLEIRGRDRDFEVSLCGSGEAVPIAKARGRRPQRSGESSDRPRRGRGGSQDRDAEEADTTDPEVAEGKSAAAPPEGEEGEGNGGGRGRSRRRGRRPRGDRDAPKADRANDSDTPEEGDAQKTARRRPRFDEMSSFDLAEDAGEDSEGGSPRRRGRSRSRGRRRGASDSSESERDGPQASAASENRPSASRSSGENSSDDDEDTLVVDDPLVDALSELPDAVESVDQIEEPKYDDDESEGEEGDQDNRALEREKRRRERKGAAPAKVEEPARPVRRRIAIVAHADRDSVLAAVLLARELRLLEGIWVYTQAELMSFFRGVVTDLREETPIYVIGFTPSPARDVIQAASVYSGRLTWVDHREWPPEDLGALRQAIGEDQVWVEPGLRSSLPILLRTFTRRSRFSDKLVDLLAGRFTEHDYERWGRLWWSRLGEVASKSGPRRSELEPLLSGRPSDLSKEAAKIDAPPPPPEVEFVSKNDFRLIHFGGYVLVIVHVPSEYDVALAARVARERYGASLSLACHEEDDIMVLAGDESVGRRTLDYSSMVDHLGDKLESVDSLSDDDHVARFRLRGWQEHPSRLDDVIGEIVMGRSTLER